MYKYKIIEINIHVNDTIHDIIYNHVNHHFYKITGGFQTEIPPIQAINRSKYAVSRMAAVPVFASLNVYRRISNIFHPGFSQK